MGVINKIMNFFLPPEEEEIVTREPVSQEVEQDQEAYPPADSRRGAKNNVVAIHSQKNVRFMLCEPRTFEETQEIADHLRSRRPVIINLQRMRSEQAAKVVDFLSGTVYALSGSISKVGPNIFLCAPENIEVQGTITDLISEDTEYKSKR